MASGYLRAARQLEAVLGALPAGPSTQRLSQTVALMQHHDAITGTDRFHVNQDYRKLIASGISDAQQLISQLIHKLLFSGHNKELDRSDFDSRFALFPEASSESSICVQLMLSVHLQANTSLQSLEHLCVPALRRVVCWRLIFPRRAIQLPWMGAYGADSYSYHGRSYLLLDCAWCDALVAAQYSLKRPCA